jgi:hypothetical protein
MVSEEKEKERRGTHQYAKAVREPLGLNIVFFPVAKSSGALLDSNAPIPQTNHVSAPTKSKKPQKNQRTEPPPTLDIRLRIHPRERIHHETLDLLLRWVRRGCDA